ncbi:MAG: hypothetical protein RR867_06410, partial [Ruthenibacterium sp.]
AGSFATDDDAGAALLAEAAVLLAATEDDADRALFAEADAAIAPVLFLGCNNATAAMPTTANAASNKTVFLFAT